MIESISFHYLKNANFLLVSFFY